MWQPNKYAELRAAKMKQHGTRAWLVNTGWSGGTYGTGKRIKLAKTRRDPVFGFDAVSECPNVPAELLIPRNFWADKAAFDAMAKKTCRSFNQKLRGVCVARFTLHWENSG